MPACERNQTSCPSPSLSRQCVCFIPFTVVIWCSLTEGNRVLHQRMSLDGSPKPIHGPSEGPDGLPWSSGQPCNPSKPKAKTSPVKSNGPAAHLEIKADELAKKRGKVVSFAHMTRHVPHAPKSASMTELSRKKKILLSKEDPTYSGISSLFFPPMIPSDGKWEGGWAPYHVCQRSKRIKVEWHPLLCRTVDGCVFS